MYRNVPVLEMMVYLGTLKGLATAEARKRSMDYLERLGTGGQREEESQRAEQRDAAEGAVCRDGTA